MSKRMLIDGAHPEEIRVVVQSGNRLDEYDIETTFKKQIKGNIYLAKVTRVEPSLQAAFVDFGGNRHGFLAFSEIHPDYYQIPIEDRQALIEEQEELEMKARAAQEHLDEMEGGISEPEIVERPSDTYLDDEHDDDDLAEHAEAHEDDDETADAVPADRTMEYGEYGEEPAPADDAESASAGAERASEEIAEAGAEFGTEFGAEDGEHDEEHEDDGEEGEAAERSSPRRSRAMRRYKIQEVIKRRQILLVQVVKEERGNKGAALTTYISLAGRYCVLMPNSSRGGGISRKITSAQERRKLRDTLNALDMPQGMGVIIRTAGLERSKAEIRRDFEYLLRAWDEVREVTLESTAPSLVYEEGNIIKRAIRDVYSKDIDEIQIEGNDTYQTAKRFMRLMMPSHAKRVQPYRDNIPLFQRFQIEQQLDAMHNPEVQLKSGGYIVINPTEALVAIDVNSGRSTRERNIEETALKTNLEAADEVARQLRLRDLAGLIVIDFIDMEDGRNVRKVERRLREAMKVDRARLQIGRISNFGLLELSRQRLRPSLLETSTQVCPHCRGTGHILSTESMAMRVLRAIEEEGIRMRSSEITVRVPTVVALYILNQKRATLVDLEGRYGFRVILQGDDSVIPPDIEIERVKGRPEPLPQAARPEARVIEIEDEDDDVEEDVEDEAEAEEEKSSGASDEQEGAKSPRRRRRRGRRGRRDDESWGEMQAAPAASDDEEGESDGETGGEAGEPVAAGEAGEPGEDDRPQRRRRRGRRGGRRRNRGANGEAIAAEGAVEGESDGDAKAQAREELHEAHDEGHGENRGEEPHETALNGVETTAPAEAEAVEAAPAIEVEPAPEPEPPAQEAAPEPEPVPAMAEANAPAPVQEAAVAVPAAVAEDAASDRPKRKGWWQRIVE